MRKILLTVSFVVLVAPFLYGAERATSCAAPKYRSPIHFKPDLPTKKAVGDVMPFYWKGEYHVFYLTNPLGNDDVNWEHCSTTDLVNSVLPGLIETRFHERFSSPERKKAVAEQTPLRRNGTAEDIAKVVLFLASDAAGFITGEYIAVNGGLYMRA